MIKFLYIKNILSINALALFKSRIVFVIPMIYLMYLASEEGTLIWNYVHPKIPDHILERIAGRDHSLMVNFLSAVSMFGYDALGSRVQIIEFEHVKMSYRYIDLDGIRILAVAITDPEDNSKLVWSAFEDFLNKNRQYLERIVPGDAGLINQEGAEKASLILSRELTRTLERKVRKFEVLGRRDLKNMLIALVIGIVFYAISISITYVMYTSYGLQYDLTEFFITIVFLDFILPGAFIGWITGYWRGALINGIIVAILSLTVLTAIWWPQLLGAVLSIFNIRPEIIIVGVVIVAGVIGAAMGLIAAFVAWYFVEIRTFVPAK